MSYTISDLKTDAENHLHGTTLNKVPGVLNLIYEAGRNVINQIDPRETKRIQQITNALYDKIYDYTVPADLKGTKVVDIRPQAGQEVSDEFQQWYLSEFQQYKERSSGIFAIKDNSGTKTIKIAKVLTQGVTLNSLDSLTANGTWAASNNAINLAVDTVYKLAGSASLKFGVSASGTDATITNSTFTEVDLSVYEDVGSLFTWVYLSDPDEVTNVKLTWGSDASNTWDQTVTTTQDGLTFQTGWNLLRFAWDGANETGSPDSSAVDYLQVNLTYNGTAITTVRVDNIVARLPEIFEIEYYSKYLFQNSSGTWIEEPTDDSDIINLDTESYNLLLYEFLTLVSQVTQGEDARFDFDFFEMRRKEAWDTYRADNKSEVKHKTTTYYRQLYEKRRK